ncbi:hypothetical protein [Chitinophaga sp. HK235]|uniref:hypothetical protein n=1 Tax=Chitinophaga sp. HK235 TaxID=2952571 RepID=UPI001BADB601|nr:hypothetical protein [Chitinophaga sp. HK235]
MNYKIITDEQALKAFIDWLPACNEHEQYYLCLLSRTKYLEGDHGLKADKQQLKRFTSKKENMLEKIKQLECAVGAYTQGGIIIPQEALALYISINPRDLWKATYTSLVTFAQNIQAEARVKNPHQEVMSAIQQSCSNKYYIDIDVDAKDPAILEQIREYLNPSCLTVMETRGGYHVLVELAAVDPAFKKSWHPNIMKLPNVDQSGDNIVPVPGCTQGGFTPKFI